MGERERLFFVAVTSSATLLDDSSFDEFCSPNPEDSAQLVIRQLSKTSRLSVISFGPETITSHNFLVGSSSVLTSLLRSFVDARREVKVVIENSNTRAPQDDLEYYSITSEKSISGLHQKFARFNTHDLIKVTMVIESYEICLLSLPPFPPFGSSGGPLKANGWRILSDPDAFVGSKTFVLLHFDTNLASETAVMKILSRQEITVGITELSITMEKGVLPDVDESEYEYEYEYDDASNPVDPNADHQQSSDLSSHSPSHHQDDRESIRSQHVNDYASIRSQHASDRDSIRSRNRNPDDHESIRSQHVNDHESERSSTKGTASARSLKQDAQPWQVEQGEMIGMRDWEKENSNGDGSLWSGRGQLPSIRGSSSQADDSQSHQSRRRKRRRRKKNQPEELLGDFADTEPLPTESQGDENALEIDDDSPEGEIKRFVSHLQMNIPVLEDASVFSTLVQQLFYEKWKSGALARTKAILLELRDKLRKKFSDEIQSMKQLVASNDLTVFLAREEQKMRLLENMAVETIQKALERRAGAYGNVTTRGLLRTFQTICGDHVTLQRKIRERRAAIRSETIDLRCAQAARLEKLQKHREVAKKVESAESLQAQLYEALERHEQVEQELTDAEEDRQALLRQLQKVRAILQSRNANNVK